MGDSVAQGTVLEWHKREGERVELDETIVEISTDKIDAEVPSPAAGTIVKIHAAEGETVAVGAILAEISANGGRDGSSGSATGTPVTGECPPTSPGEALAGAETEAQGAASLSALSGQMIDIVTPTGGESVTEGTILEWSVKVGDVVQDGDIVVEISTDKVDMELPAPAAGTITEILVPDGETVGVGQVIARMSAAALPSAPDATPGAASGADPPLPPPSASPVARRVAAHEGIDLANVHGSAPRGRITKADVLGAARHGPAASERSAPASGRPEAAPA
ncbi:MAG: biotin/lipoyl-containing protein, partial [Solirubrobacteraceae bacterium]